MKIVKPGKTVLVGKQISWTRELSKIAQSRNGYLAILTGCINRAIDLLKKPNSFSDVALISEKLEFSLFKLERVTDENCKYASSNQQSQTKTLLLENNRGEIAIKQCKQYLDREEILSQCRNNKFVYRRIFWWKFLFLKSRKIPQKRKCGRNLRYQRLN